MPRLFFALYPDQQVRSRIQSIINSLPSGCGRPVAEFNSHMTLAFLGNVEEPVCDALILGASSLRLPPFTLTLDTLSWWRKPKIALLAPTSYPNALPRLASDLHNLSHACGLNLEKRPYRPHLTLARKVVSALPDSQLEPISWNINEFCLLESKTCESGVKYQVKVSWPLKIM